MGALTNAGIGELLAIEAETAKPPLQKALRRAARRAFLWPEEAAQLVDEGRSLEEFSGIGPALNGIIRRWMNDPLPSRSLLRYAADFLRYLRHALC